MLQLPDVLPHLEWVECQLLHHLKANGLHCVLQGIELEAHTFLHALRTQRNTTGQPNMTQGNMLRTYSAQPAYCRCLLWHTVTPDKLVARCAPTLQAKVTPVADTSADSLHCISTATNGTSCRAHSSFYSAKVDAFTAAA